MIKLKLQRIRPKYYRVNDADGVVHLCNSWVKKILGIKKLPHILYVTIREVKKSTALKYEYHLRYDIGEPIIVNSKGKDVSNFSWSADELLEELGINSDNKDKYWTFHIEYEF